MTTLVSISLVLVACSSKDSDSPAPAPGAQDSGPASPAPTATSDPQPMTPIPLTIQGSGRVVTKDSAVDCTSDGTTQSGSCTITKTGDVLYASHGYNWSFDHWEPSGLEDSTMLVPNTGAPTQITAVFVELSKPADAGAD
jgi:hypothetical protein